MTRAKSRGGAGGGFSTDQMQGRQKIEALTLERDQNYSDTRNSS